MYQDLQVNRLRALVTVYDLGSFRLAAEALHLTQPAVSQQIKQLGRFIKSPIFTSTKQGLHLSPRGQELLGYARRVVALNDEIGARFAPAASPRTLSIGVSDQLAETLPAILRHLAAAIPDAQICAVTGRSEILGAGIATGRLDLALILNAMSSPQGANYELGRLTMGWFGQPVRREGATLPLALFSEPCELRSRIVDILDKSNTSWRIAYEGSELTGVRAGVKAGLGVACLIANSDELWGLPRSVDLSLPEPPGPVAVTLVMLDRARHLAAIASDALEGALATYPFAAAARTYSRSDGASPGVPLGGEAEPFGSGLSSTTSSARGRPDSVAHRYV